MRKRTQSLKPPRFYQFNAVATATNKLTNTGSFQSTAKGCIHSGALATVRTGTSEALWRDQATCPTLALSSSDSSPWLRRTEAAKGPAEHGPDPEWRCMAVYWGFRWGCGIARF